MSQQEFPTENVDFEDIDEVHEELPYKYTITAYGADFDVDGLVRRLQDEDIIIPTFDPEPEEESTLGAFQRSFVWTRAQMDKFIDSLLLGLPVPGIFLVKDLDGRFLVLDGQQRLRTLQFFYEGMYRGKEFRLKDVHGAFKDKTYKDLDQEDRRRLNNSIIHATIVRQEEPSEDQSSIYLIFERLNTGGTLLQPQQIRVALYRGQFVELLRDLNDHPSWRTLYGRKSPALKDHELILRFFALLYAADSYKRPMKGFLNEFLGKHRHLTRIGAEELGDIFMQSSDAILESLGPKAFRFRKAVNVALADSVMVGVAHCLRENSAYDPAKLMSAYQDLLSNGKYVESIEKATADEDSVRKRLRYSREAFEGANERQS